MVLAASFGFAWFRDVQRRNLPRSDWTSRDLINVRRLIFAGGVGVAVSLGVVIGAMHAGDTYLSGLLIGPGCAAAAALAAGLQVRQSQLGRRRYARDAVGATQTHHEGRTDGTSTPRP
jgi:hypothetical protein